MKRKVTTRKKYSGNSDLNIKLFKYWPDYEKTKRISEEAVRKDGRALRYVPDKLKDWNMVLTAVIFDGTLLQYAPDYLRTEEICLEAVKQNGYALKWVPKIHKNSEILEAAVEQNGTALEFCPAEKITKELCYTALSHQTMRKYSKLQFVPPRFYSKELFLLAVEMNPYELDAVPMEFRKDEKICRAAVLQIPEMIEHVPAEYQNTSLFLAIFETILNDYPVYPVPGDFISGEMRIFALQNSILAKEYLMSKNEKFKLLAVKNQKNNEVDQFEIDLYLHEFCTHINNILGNLSRCSSVPRAFDPDDLYITKILTKDNGNVIVIIDLQTAIDLNVYSQKLLKETEFVACL